MKFEIEKGRLIHCSPDIPDKWVSTLRPRIRVCTQELDLIIPSNVTSISRTAFDEIYPYIKTVVLPDGLNSLSPGLFMRFISLEELVIGEGPKTIPAGFLMENISLKKVVIPATVKTISKGAFRECRNLQAVEFRGNGLQIIEKDTFISCNISELKFPSSLKEIGNDAFNGNKSLKRVVFSSPVKMIKGWHAPFKYCSLEEMTTIDENGNPVICHWNENGVRIE